MIRIPSILQILIIIVITSTLLSFGMLKDFDSSNGRFDPIVLEWDENRPLTWSDFETRKEKSHISALTASGIEYYYDCRSGVMTVDIKAIFIPKQSWVRSDSKTDYILAHEQLHFDITELYARKFRREFEESGIDCSNVKALEKLSDQILAEWRREQNRYDKESLHSNDEEKQAYWNTKVNRHLELSKNFSYSPASN